LIITGRRESILVCQTFDVSSCAKKTACAVLNARKSFPKSRNKKTASFIDAVFFDYRICLNAPAS